MGRRCRETVGIELRANLLRGPAEVAGEFDFLVADTRDLLERALDVLLHRVADGVELDAYAGE